MDELDQLVQGCTKANGGKELEIFSVKSVDVESRQITAIASTETLDRHNEIVSLGAFKKAIPGYMKNSVILACHQHRLSDGRSPVVGSAVKAWVEKKAFYIVVEFAKTDLGEEYWQLYSQNHQKAFSIGFRVIKSSYKMIDGKNVMVIEEIELIEISCVAVPANPDALSKSKQQKKDFVRGKREHKEAAEFFDEIGIKDWEKYYGEDEDDAAIQAEIKALFPDRDFEAEAVKYADALFGEEDYEGEPGGTVDMSKRAEPRPRTIADHIIEADQRYAKIFGSKLLYRRFKQYRDRVRKGEYLGCFSSEELELFRTIEDQGVEPAIKQVREGFGMKKMFKGKPVDLASLVAGRR